MKHLFWLILMLPIVLTGCGLSSRADQPAIVISTFRGDLTLGGLYAIHSDGSHAGGIPMGLGDDPQWSKDGKWVVFSIDNLFEVNATQIILMKANGSKRISLTDKKRGNHSPAWSPDSSTIAYEAGGVLYTINVSCFVKGNNPKECPITPKRITEGYAPDWDPTGTKLLYNTYESPSHERLIKVINADSSGSAETINPSYLLYCRNPKWSPNGEEIVFGCGGGKMYRLHKDGTIINSYIDQGISGGNPKWSPDGERILFVSVMGNDLRKPLNMEGSVVSDALYSMKPDGTDILRLTSRNDESIRWFAWMP